jgi:hypothetical protein
MLENAYNAVCIVGILIGSERNEQVQTSDNFNNIGGFLCNIFGTGEHNI